MVPKTCIDSLPHIASTVNSTASKENSDHLLARALLATKAAKIGIWEYFIEQKTLMADDVLLSHFGITTPCFTGHYEELWALVHPQDSVAVGIAFKKALQNQSHLTLECRIIWQDKTLHYIKVDAVFQWDLNGHPCSLVGSCQDISTQKQAVIALHDSEARFRTFHENLPDALILTITDGKILAANPEATKMFQMTEEEICQAGSFGLVDRTDPRLRHLLEARVRNGWAKGEVTCIRKDGTKFPAEINSIVVTDRRGENRTSIMIRDLSETRNAEEKLLATTRDLQQSLTSLNKIMDSSLDLICTVNEGGRFISMSAASERILGYSPQELINSFFVEHVLPEDLKKTEKEELKIKTGHATTMFENRVVHKDGRIVSMLWSASWDENDKISYCIGKDVTAKNILEKSIEVERQRFIDLYAQAPSCMGVLKGPNHVFELANPLYLELIQKQDIIGKTIKEVLPEFEAQGLLKLLDDVFNTGETFSVSETLVKIDLKGNGELEDFYLNFIAQAHRDIEDNIDGIFFFAIDVTEQVVSRKKIEQSEKKYRQIVETAQEGIWLIDECSKTTFVNKKLCEILEYSKEEMMGRVIFDFMDEKSRHLAADLMLHRKAGKSGQNNFKYISKSGKQIWTNLSANPLFNESGSYKGSLAMVTDITDRIILEKQLRDEQIEKHKEIAKAVIYAQEKERRQTGEELHDNINQLLVAAKLFLGHSLIIEDDHKPFVKKSEEYLSTAIEEIRKLTQALVGPAKEKEIGLVYSIKELIADITSIRNIQIDFRNDSYQEADSEEAFKLVLYRIIQEQISNILKHAEATHVVISIRKENDCLALLIQDNGKGFDTSARRKGIGFKNIQNRAEIYNGEVSINSSPGNGCSLLINFQELH